MYCLTSDEAKAQLVFKHLQCEKIVICTLDEFKNQVLNKTVKGFGYVFTAQRRRNIPQTTKN